MAGTTPNNSWPYPESSDFVADGATAIENLADAIDADFDTGVLKVDSTNSRVGINDATPSYALDVTGDINATGDIRIGGDAITDYQTFTPGWHATTTDPTIGSGQLDGEYTRAGDVIVAKFQLVTAADTTYGSGVWYFDYPVATASEFASYQLQGFGYVGAAGGFYPAYPAYRAGSANGFYVYAISGTTINFLSGGFPGTWSGAGQSLKMTLVYKAA